MPDFPDLATLNAWLEQRRVDLRRDIPHEAQSGTIAGVWAEEQAAQLPLPPAFDGFVEQSKRVSPTRFPAAHAGMRERGPDTL